MHLPHHTGLTNHPLRAQLFAFKASLFIPLVEIWLRTRGLVHCKKGLNQLASRFTLNTSLPANSEQEANNIALLVSLGNQTLSIYSADCLTQSLVVHYFLTRKNIQSQVIFGVRTITGSLEAHAWVEHQQQPLNEKDDVKSIYQVFDWNDNKDIPII